jgi:hypothetical protein
MFWKPVPDSGASIKFTRFPEERGPNRLRGHSADTPKVKFGETHAKLLQILAHPTRFERVTFAFGGQRDPFSTGRVRPVL